MNRLVARKLLAQKALFAFSFVCMCTAALFPLPSHAEAGFFSSFVESFFEKGAVLTFAEKTETNSQNANLLEAALHVDPNPAKGGGDILIVGDSALLPESGPSGTLADMSDADAPATQISLYVVRDGDSLSQIANMFGVSTNTIIWANDITRGDLVRVGQTLVIMPVSGVQHTVTKGDTIAGIAKKYKGDTAEVLAYNGLEEGVKLSVGDSVFVPNGVIKTATPSAVQVAGLRGTNVPNIEGYYMRPIAGGVKSQGLHGYNAVDLAAPVGTPLLAAASGDVTIAKNGGWNGGYGSYIVIKHPNGTQTLYGHASSVIVKTGQHVVKGQVIGYLGNTGRSTGPHLHFEIRGAKNPF